MDEVFFLLVAILGSHVEGIKIRATRRRFIEYPHVSETRYVQKAPIHRDSGIHNYVDRHDIRYNAYGGHTYGGYVNRNSPDTINKSHMFWTKENEPETSQLGEGRSGQIDDDDEQNLHDEEERIDNSVDQSDTNSRPSSENGDQNNSTKIDDIEVLRESDAAKTDPFSASINPSKQNFNSAGKGNINTVYQSEINVNDYKRSPLRYTAVEYNMLPPLSRRLYSVNGIKINRESEAPLYNNMDEVSVNKEENSDHIRFVPEHYLTTLNADGKYSADQSKYNWAKIARLKDGEDEINVSNEERIGFANEFPKRASLKNILRLVNVDAEKHMVPVNSMAEDELTSKGRDLDMKNFIDEILDSNTKNANYTYEEEKNHVPFYPYLLRPNQQQLTRVYKPRKIAWKRVNISRGIQPHSIIYNKRRNWRVNPVAENTSLLNKLVLKLCRKCEYLMKALNITQDMDMLNGLFDNLETSGSEDDYDYEYEDKINIPGSISWDYSQGENQEEPIYDVRYHQPHTQFKKVLKEGNPQMNTAKTLYGYRGANTFEQPQSYNPAELDRILHNAHKPQEYPLEPINDALGSYILLKGKKKYLRTPAHVKEDQRPAETQSDFSKPIRKILQLEDVYDTNGDSKHMPGADYWNKVPAQSSVVGASKIHTPYNAEIHVIRNIPEYLLSSKSPDSSETSTTHTTATPEGLLPLKTPDATEIPATFTPLVTHWNTIPEESLLSKATHTPDLPTVSTSVPTDWKTTPEELLHSKAPYVSNPTMYVPLVTDQYDGKTTPEESVPSKAPDIFEKLSTKTTVTTDWNTITDKLKPSKSPNASTSTTYSPSSSLITDQKNENTTRNELLLTKSSAVVNITYVPLYRKDEITIQKESRLKASKTHTTNPPLVTNRKDRTTAPEELPSKASKASEIRTTNPPLVTDRKDGTTVPEELPSKVSEASETPTTNHLLVINREDGSTVPEGLPSKGSEASERPKTNPPLVTNRKEGNTIPEELTFKASDASKAPTTNLPLVNNRKNGTTLPEELTSKYPDTGDIPTTYVPLVSYRKDRKTTPKELLSSKAFDASKIPTTHAAPVINEKDGNNTPEKQYSKSPKAIEIPTTPTRLATNRKVGTLIPEELPSKSLDAIDTTTMDVPLATHRTLITGKWFPSTEHEVNDKSTTYVPLSSDQSIISKEWLSSKVTEASEIRTTTPTPLATNRYTIPKKSLLFKTPNAIDISITNVPFVTEQSAISEEFLPSIATEAIHMSTSSAPLATHWNTITEKSLPSKTPDAINISTTDVPLAANRSAITEEFLPSKAAEATEISILSTPPASNRNTIKLLLSKALATGRSALPSKVPYVSTIPVSVIYDRDISESSESPKASDESELPTSYIPVPIDWAIITKEMVPSKVPNVLNISTTDIPDDGKKPEKIFSQAPDESKIVTVAPSVDDWIDEPKKTLLSKVLFKLGTSYTQNLKDDENDQSEQLPNLEETTPEQFISQIINVLIPYLLKLYSSKCYKGVDEELLKGLKAIIESVQQKQCETSQEYY